MMYLWILCAYAVLGLTACVVLFPTRDEFVAERSAPEAVQRPVNDYAGSVTSVVVRGVGSGVQRRLRAAGGYVARHAARAVGVLVRRHRARGGFHRVDVDTALELWVDGNRGGWRAGRHSLEARMLASALLEA